MSVGSVAVTIRIEAVGGMEDAVPPFPAAAKTILLRLRI
jgi:hypothetical protein